jgi:integrase/recombinase XerD
MTWEELARGYRAARLELSLSTQRRIQSWLEHFSNWANRQQLERPEQLRREHLERYHQTLLWSPSVRGQLYAPNSVGQALQMIRAALRWAAEQESQPDPCAGWLQPRAIQPVPRCLTRDQVHRLLNSPRSDHPLGRRDQAILAMLYSLGLPHSVCIGLDVGQLDLAARSLAVGPRRMSLGAVLEAALTLYLNQSRPQLVRNPHEPALFLTKHGRRLSLITARVMMKQHARAAGLNGVTARILARSSTAHAEELMQRLLFSS